MVRPDEVLGMNSPDMSWPREYSPKLPQQGAKLIHEMEPGNMVDFGPSRHRSTQGLNFVAATYARRALRPAQQDPAPHDGCRRFDIQERKPPPAAPQANGEWQLHLRHAHGEGRSA